MVLITRQTEVSIQIVRSKIGQKDHRVAVNLISPDVGVVIDGHHDYMASLIDHKPLRIVVAGLHHSNHNTSAALLDFWDEKFRTTQRSDKWQYYNLMTGKEVGLKWLMAIVEKFPDYHYTV